MMMMRRKFLFVPFIAFIAAEQTDSPQKPKPRRLSTPASSPTDGIMVDMEDSVRLRGKRLVIQ